MFTFFLFLAFVAIQLLLSFELGYVIQQFCLDHNSLLCVFAPLRETTKAKIPVLPLDGQA